MSIEMMYSSIIYAEIKMLSVFKLQDEEEEEEKPLKPSPDGDTYILFTKPSVSSGMLLVAIHKV